jgi:hypothetical protein
MDSRRHFHTYSWVSEPSVNLAEASLCDGLRIISNAFKLMTLGEHLGRCHDPREEGQDAISIIKYSEMILEGLEENQLRQTSKLDSQLQNAPCLRNPREFEHRSVEDSPLPLPRL